MSRKPKPLDIDGAEAIALSALAFLASDMARLGRFLALTGVGPAELRSAAGTPTLQAAVLDHLLNDESMLLVFSSEQNVDPQRIGFAHALLAREGHLRGES